MDDARESQRRDRAAAHAVRRRRARVEAKAPSARHPTSPIVKIAASGDPELSCEEAPAAARSTTRGVVVVVRDVVPRADPRIEVDVVGFVGAAAFVDVVGASVTGVFVVTVGAGCVVAAETDGARVVGGRVGREVGGDVVGGVGGVVARVVGGGGGSAAAGEMPGCA